jgi:hypothetical protein
MFIKVLCFALPNPDPESKYFLVRFVQYVEERCVEVTDPVQCSVKDLAKCFGITDSQVTGSLTVLLASDVLGFSDIAAGKGRPKRWYRLTDDYLRKLNKPPPEPRKSHHPPPFNEIHEAAIGRLLKHENSKTGQKSAKLEQRGSTASLSAQMRASRQPGRLSIVNRLLLSVLLCYADRFGVVRDLGSSALCKATGLNQERLKCRIKKLLKEGLLSAYVPGVTSTILSEKTKSVYFVNLHHPELLNAGCGARVFTRLTIEPAMGIERQRAFWFWDDVKRLEREPSCFMNTTYEQVPKFFRGQSPLFAYFLQSELDRYAAFLLSNSWPELVESGPGRIRCDELCGLIRKTFRPSTRLPSNQPLRKGGFAREGQLSSVIDMLYCLAYAQAFWIKQCVSKNSTIDFTSLEFVVVPLSPESGFTAFSVLALPNASAGKILAEDNHSAMNGPC